MRIIAVIVIILSQLGAALVGLILLLVVLNGYSEKQAMPSLVFYVAFSVAAALLLGVGSGLALRRLAPKTRLGPFGASASVIGGFSILGMLILVVLFFASIVLAEILRSIR